MRVLVFTAALGQTDTVRAPRVVDPQAEYVCFSDRPCVAPYEWVPVPTSSTPMLDARRLKILADHPRLAGADVTFWHDASYRLRRNLQWLRRAMRQADLAALRHPRRSLIEIEALIIAKYGYLSADAARAHVARYRAAGFLAQVLTATGLLARRLSAAVTTFNETWWIEAQQWSGRDQTSVDYAAWVAGLQFTHLPGTIRANRMAEWRHAEAVHA